jgi:hypothetical protein
MVIASNKNAPARQRRSSFDFCVCSPTATAQAKLSSIEFIFRLDALPARSSRSKVRLLSNRNDGIANLSRSCMTVSSAIHEDREVRAPWARPGT